MTLAEKILAAHCGRSHSALAPRAGPARGGQQRVTRPAVARVARRQASPRANSSWRGRTNSNTRKELNLSPGSSHLSSE